MSMTCGLCENSPIVFCASCDPNSYYCDKCDELKHRKGLDRCDIESVNSSSSEKQTSLEEENHERVYLCQECEESLSMVHCDSCEQFLCQDCDKRIHNKGARQKHVRDTQNKVSRKEEPIEEKKEILISPAPQTLNQNKLRFEIPPFIPSY